MENPFKKIALGLGIATAVIPAEAKAEGVFKEEAVNKNTTEVGVESKKIDESKTYKLAGLENVNEDLKDKYEKGEKPTNHVISEDGTQEEFFFGKKSVQLIRKGGEIKVRFKGDQVLSFTGKDASNPRICDGKVIFQVDPGNGIAVGYEEMPDKVIAVYMNHVGVVSM